MILVFGGTTEGKQVAAILDSLELPYYYSTKTAINFEGTGIAISGALTTSEIEAFCKTHHVTHIINASHPFAKELHENIATITSNVPLIRFERYFPERTTHELVNYVNSFQEAIYFFKKKQYKKLLALSGVQTIHQLTEFWKENETWFRILDRDSSKGIAKKSGFPSENLLFGYPQSSEEEIDLYNQLKPDVIFTKESGTNGKLEQKIIAAISTKTPITILTKPLISKRYICIQTKTQLNTILKAYTFE
ncbi:precorrin-6A/cobalt-precorrin-6A reductase [Tenacibaculum sp.]|nr:precorrin-6A/cobalt-precorrin-6A reductase [Tenacibaculum sp.]